MSENTIEAARELREELKAQIRRLSAGSRSRDRCSEELGLPRDSDRVVDLKRHLAQVESLLDVLDDGLIEIDPTWFPAENAERSAPPA